MGELFNLDNGFFRSISKLVDCIFVTLLWIIGCIPIFTIGASTTALYYTVHKVIHLDRSYVFHEFKQSFMDNFKQSTIVWLIMLAIGAFLGSDAYVTYQLKQQGDKVGIIFYFIVLLLILELVVFIFAFPYISRFQDDTKRVFKNAFFLSFGNPIKMILMLITTAVAGFIVYIFPPLFIIAPAFYMLAIEQFMERIYKKFIPEEETDDLEEKPVDGKSFRKWKKNKEK
jgi:uncharacterized membrane protein YesL